MTWSNLRKYRLHLDSAAIRRIRPIFSHRVTQTGYTFRTGRSKGDSQACSPRSEPLRSGGSARAARPSKASLWRVPPSIPANPQKAISLQFIYWPIFRLLPSRGYCPAEAAPVVARPRDITAAARFCTMEPTTPKKSPAESNVPA